MALGADWKKPEPYEYTDELDEPDWGWEFLRRSDAYRSDFERLQQTRTRFGAAVAAVTEVEVGQRWGLRFCRRPEPPRDRR